MYTSNDSLIYHVLHHLKQPWKTAVAFERAVYRSGLQLEFDYDFHPVFSLREAVFNDLVKPHSAVYEEVMDEFSSQCVLKLDDFLTSYPDKEFTFTGVTVTRRKMMESLLHSTIENYGQRHHTAVFFKKLLETDYLDGEQVVMPAIRL